MKKSILNLSNVEVLTSELKKNIFGGNPKVEIIEDYCCIDAYGNPAGPLSGGGGRRTGNGACPNGYTMAPSYMCANGGTGQYGL